MPFFVLATALHYWQLSSLWSRMLLSFRPVPVLRAYLIFTTWYLIFPYEILHLVLPSTKFNFIDFRLYLQFLKIILNAKAAIWSACISPAYSISKHFTRSLPNDLNYGVEDKGPNIGHAPIWTPWKYTSRLAKNHDYSLNIFSSNSASILFSVCLGIFLMGDCQKPYLRQDTSNPAPSLYPLGQLSSQKVEIRFIWYNLFLTNLCQHLLINLILQVLTDWRPDPNLVGRCLSATSIFFHPTPVPEKPLTFNVLLSTP